MSEGINTRGTHIWLAYDGAAVQVGCATDISGIGGSRETSKSDPCLADGSRKNIVGGIDWEDVSIELRSDPAVDSQDALWELFNEGSEDVEIVIGYADGTDPATYSGSAWTLPTTRSFYRLKGTIISNTDAIPGEGVVQGTVVIAPSEAEKLKKGRS